MLGGDDQFDIVDAAPKCSEWVSVRLFAQFSRIEFLLILDQLTDHHPERLRILLQRWLD